MDKDNNNLNFDFNFDDLESLKIDDDTNTSDKISNRTPAVEEKAKLLARNMAAAGGMFSDSDDDYVTPPKEMPTMQEQYTSRRSSAERSENPKPKSEVKSKSRKKKKKSNTGIKVAVFLTVFLLVAGGGCAAFYLAGLNSYKNVFLDNTYINQINVSGKTQAEAYEMLKANSTIPEKVTVVRKDGSEFSVKLSDIGYIDNTKAVISQYYSQQNHYEWLKSKFNTTEFNFTNTFKYDKDKLEELLKRKAGESNGVSEPVNAYIQAEDNNTFTVIKEVDGDKVDPAKMSELYKYVEDALDEDIFYVDISSADIYKKAEITADMLEESCERLNNIYSMEISFDFTYTKEILSGERIMDWITIDSDLSIEGYTVDEDKAMEYVEELAAKYDTYGKDRQFMTTNRGEITIPEGQGCYGWWIDQQKTCDLLVKLIEEGDSVDTEPVYYVSQNSGYSYTCNSEWRTAEKDYGDTYIEVDLSAQHLWYYKNGKVEMETDIVSGYPSESRNTPAGVYKLWLKQEDKTLTGSSDGKSYSSFVDYWNNISTISIGLHDASWQGGVFGGNKYKSSTWGSHGCVNMPLSKAKYVYENVDYGTPVFMYWS